MASNGKLSWIETDDKSKADIICKWQSAPGQDQTNEGGVTSPEGYTDANGKQILDLVTITIFTLGPNPVDLGLVPITDAWARATCLHEIGHALGISFHSSNRNDVMFMTSPLGLSPPDDLTSRDKATIRRLYESYAASDSGKTSKKGE